MRKHDLIRVATLWAAIGFSAAAVAEDNLGDIYGVPLRQGWGAAAANVGNSNSPSLFLRGDGKLAPIPGAALRSPTTADDANVPLPVGSTWIDASGNVLQSIDATPGFAMWQQVQSAMLPGDVIGLNATAATYVAAGSGCVANEVLTFLGGMQVTVTVCTGGVPTTYSITQSRLHACPASLSPTAVVPVATTGGDAASTWNLTLQAPWLYANQLLTRCYTGNKAINVSRSYGGDTTTGETLDIGFLNNGALDAKTLDGFTGASQPMAQYVTYASGVSPRVNTWYDQGLNVNNMTQATLASRPTIFPGRLNGSVRSIMFDASFPSDSWSPSAATFLNLPGGLSVTLNNNTVAVIGGNVTPRRGGSSLLHVGGQGALPMLYIESGVSTLGMVCQNNTSNKIYASVLPDEGTIILCASSNGGTTFYSGNAVATGAAGASSSVSGGTVGEFWNTSASYPTDVSLVAVVPWAMTATEQASLRASMVATFNIGAQKRGVLVALGDSHIDAWGYPYQQHLLRQAASLLGRPDISFVDDALAGANISSVLGAVWTGLVAPVLAQYPQNSAVLIEGGYADIGAGQTVAQVQATYGSLAVLAHAAGAKVICDTGIIRSATTTLNNQMQALAAWMLLTPSVCDYVWNEMAYSVFNQASGPWGLPWYEQQDGGVHPTAAGNALRAASLAAMIQNNAIFK